MNYTDVLNNSKVIEIYKGIDEVNQEYFSHGMRHIKNVCNIMSELCDLLNVDKYMKEALLIASALHDIGQLKSRENHGRVAMEYIIDNYEDELKNNKYYNDILYAVDNHSEESKESDTLFTILLQAADKFDFSKNRLEDNGSFFTEHVEKVEFIYDDTYFGLNIITTNIDNFEELFLDLKFFRKVINVVRVLAIKLNRKPIIKENNNILKGVNF